MTENAGVAVRQKPTTHRRRRARPVPSLHLVMIRIACAGVVFGGLGYYLAPTEKVAFFERMSEWSMVFLFGKFTNGFGIKSVDGNDTDEKESDA